MIKILKKIENDIGLNDTRTIFKYNDNEYSHVGVRYSKSMFDNFIYDDKNNLILKEENMVGEPYKLVINKEILDKNFIEELNKSGIISLSEEKYNDAESFTPVETFIKNHKNEKETDIYKISNHKTGVYQITTNFMFKYDDQFFTLKLKHDLDEERNKNTKLFKLYLNDENGDKISNLGDLYVSNGKKDLFIEEVSLNVDSKIDTNNILNKINDFFDLKLNVNLGNYYKQISTNNKSNEKLIDIDFNDKDLKSKNYLFHKTANSNSISTNNIRIYEEKKENLVGTEINKVKYRSKYFNKKLFNIIKSDADLSSFVNEKTYSDVVKNGTDLSQDKFILSKEKEIEDNQER